jgi:alpha-ribazole phosphatase
MNRSASSAGDDAADGVTIHIWRHPRAQGAEGRCIGRTDLSVDRRKAKRLAHRIRAFARRHGLPREIVTSPLRRCADVGRVLADWGWVHRIDTALIELDFGDWDGRAWSDVSRAEFDRWCSDLLNCRPGDGESVAELLERVRTWRSACECLAVGHGGWISGACWLAASRTTAAGAAIAPNEWPLAPAHGRYTSVRLIGVEASPGRRSPAPYRPHPSLEIQLRPLRPPGVPWPLAAQC